jgi:hypothetical protein
MPIEFSIRHDLRLVVAEAKGVMTDADVFGYQRAAWSRPDVYGYNELIDMSQVIRINLVDANRIDQLARVSAKMDAPAVVSKFAIFAPSDLAFALGRMYQVHRKLEPESTKEVGVFRSLAEALAFLGLAEDPRKER